jgi:hypothetical protein
VDIHPYVQGRLRTLPRQDEAAGILLGSSENGVTYVTGFRRAAPGSLRQAASDAGPALAGFYRLQTQSAPTLLPEEEDLWREVQPDGRSLYLLVRPVAGGVEGTAWTRDSDRPAEVEKVSLDGERAEPEKLEYPLGLRLQMTTPANSKRVLWLALVGLAVAAGAIAYWPARTAPGLSLDLESRNGELAAVWEQQGTPKEPLQFALLSILDGNKEQTMDLTRSYTSKGRVTVRPRASDVVLTLRLQYAGLPPVSRSATYVGFVPVPEVVVPPPVATPEPARPTPAPKPELAAASESAPVAPNAEIAALRKRNKELEEAVAALRKHFLP